MSATEKRTDTPIHKPGSYKPPPWVKTCPKEELNDPRLKFAGLAALGAVTKLRHLQWLSESNSIPATSSILGHLLLVDKDELEKVLPVIKKVFTSVSSKPQELQDTFLAAMRDIAEEIGKKQRASGSKGGQRRAQKAKESPPEFSAN